MQNAFQTMPAGLNDVSFGRSYAVHGDTVPEFRMPPGWWLLPAVVGGIGGWVMLISAIFF
ncbi:MAG: hypothetical protein RSE12_20540 [Fuscovulum sp.]|jgi:hypothetical protein|nr:hypothetical protein [Paracoccaceae bacterium]MCZ8084645.1 hypothetical protein [Paracoccaceae bacterium]WRH62710.1 MAG: hypothetical protein RSE12_20540 [Fuscovulum sp.]